MELLTLYGDSRLEIKSESAQQAIVRGYGVVFQGRDYLGDTFIKETDYGLKRIIGTPVFLEHALEGFKSQIGEVINYGIDDFGLWIEAKIDTSIRVVKDYLEKIRKGLVGWSSGTAGHLIDRIKNVITRWHVAEFSLTTHPADKRTLGVQQVKNINPEILSILQREQESPREEKGVVDGRHILVNTKVEIKTTWKQI